MVTVDHCYSIYYINSSYDSDDSDDSDDSWDSYCPDRLAPIQDPVRIRSQVARLEYVASREHTVSQCEGSRSLYPVHWDYSVLHSKKLDREYADSLPGAGNDCSSLYVVRDPIKTRLPSSDICRTGTLRKPMSSCTERAYCVFASECWLNLSACMNKKKECQFWNAFDPF